MEKLRSVSCANTLEARQQTILSGTKRARVTYLFRNLVDCVVEYAIIVGEQVGIVLDALLAMHHVESPRKLKLAPEMRLGRWPRSGSGARASTAGRRGSSR